MYVVGPDYYAPPKIPRMMRMGAVFTGVHSNQDLIWCEKIGIYMGFVYIVGPDYYGSP